jgi:hypothetical protein
MSTLTHAVLGEVAVDPAASAHLEGEARVAEARRATTLRPLTPKSPHQSGARAAESSRRYCFPRPSGSNRALAEASREGNSRSPGGRSPYRCRTAPSPR